MRILIETLISKDIHPAHLEVLDESYMHSVPEGAQSHFKVTVVSDVFEGCTLIQRHRRMNQLLQPAFDKGIHALALHTMTPEEWNKKGGVSPTSPQCQGGSN